MKSKPSEKSAPYRNYSFDIMKIFAALAVVLIHSSSKAVEDATTFACTDYFLANTFNAISRFAVPVFVMISGALILDEKKKITTELIYSKYIRSLIPVFLFWSALFTYVFAYVEPLKAGYAVYFDNIVTYFISGHYHLWYLFMLTGLYISTPIFRMFVKKENKSIVQYFLKVGFIVQGIIPFIIQLIKTFDGTNFTETLDSYNFDIFLGFGFYFVAGWYLNNFELKAKTLKAIYILGALSVIFSILFTYFASVNLHKPYYITYRNFYFNNILYAFAVFLFFKKTFEKITFTPKNALVITKLSSLTFGVYLVHPLIIHNLRIPYSEITPQPLNIIIMWLSVLAISFCLCFLVSKIPLLKKLIKT